MKKVLSKILLVTSVICLLFGVTGCKKDEMVVEPSTEEVVDVSMFNNAQFFLDDVYGYNISGTVSGTALAESFPEELKDLVSSYESLDVEAEVIPDSVMVAFYKENSDELVTKVIVNESGMYWDLSQTVTVMDDFQNEADIVAKLMDVTDDAVYVAYDTDSIVNGGSFNSVIADILTQCSLSTIQTSENETGVVAEVQSADFNSLGDSILEQVVKSTNGCGEISISISGEEQSRRGFVTITSETVSFHGEISEESHVTKGEEPYFITLEEFKDAVQNLIDTNSEASSEQ